MLAFVRAEVAIARGQGQAAFGAFSLYPDDVDGQGELAHHGAHHGQLLVVFFAKNGDGGLHDLKQLHDHGADAAEETGAEFAFQHIGHGSRWLHAKDLRLRIKLCFARGKNEVAACSLQLFAIGDQGAWVGVKVFVRQKLQAVDKQTGNHAAGAASLLFSHRAFYQAQMTSVQIAHGGHKGGALARESRAQFGDGVKGLHSGHLQNGRPTKRAGHRRGSCRLSQRGYRLQTRL